MPDIKISSLYDNTIKLQFDAKKHHYTVDGVTVDGVTSILNIINKPALVYWSANKAAEYIEKNLPIGRALDELEVKKLASGCKTAHRTLKDDAADIGTMFHNWAAQHIQGKNPDKPLNSMLLKAVEQFLQWIDDKKVKFKNSERVVYSKKYNYAGTYDFTAIIDGKRVLGDIKTSTGIWDEYWLQVAAYKQALQEEFSELTIDETVIVRCGKDGSFETQTMNHFEKNIKGFLGALELFRWQKNMKFTKEI